MEEEVFGVGVDACALEFFAVPGVAELECFVVGLNVVEAGGACVLVCLFVKDDEGVFFLVLTVLDGFVDVLLEELGCVGLFEGVLPEGGFVGGKG